MLDVNVYTLEDGKDYSLVDSLVYRKEVYVLLCEIDNTQNICIRKLKKENDTEYFQRLDRNFNEIYKMFIDKNSNLVDRN